PDAEVRIYGRPWLKDLLPFLNLGEHASYHEVFDESADMVMVFPNSFRSAWQAFRSRTPIRVGFQKEARGFLLSHAYVPRVDVMTQHHRGYFLDLVEQAGVPVIQREVELIAHEEDIQAGITLMQLHDLDAKRVICIAPGAHFGGAKRYPSESYAAVIQWLGKQGWQPLMLGTANERGVADACLKLLPSGMKFWNAAGETSMREALQLVSACRLMLCNDSGLMHIAAGMNKPTVGIFGATLPARTAPSGKYVKVLYEPAVCSPCLQRECTTLGQPCMGNILPEMVLDSCMNLLNP
ncbi:MAG: lipopolysaccharide heptosyltransferase II, partial [Mariprofundaceae bacterium]|nr:lipopolysaccharide heptosyltransferase II [Mariprofundaceae bacterium]